MAISIDWGTRVISVPQVDLTFISGTLFALDTNALRLALKDLEDDENGMPHPDTHRNFSEVTIAGVTYARTIEIINGYTVTFEDGQYAVRLDGSNNNLFDEGIINRNQVSVIPTNSAGLQIVTQGSGLSTPQAAALDEIHGQIPRAVYVDTAATINGDGYQQLPHNTIDSAITNAITNNLRRIHVRGTATITNTDISGLEFIGLSVMGSSITVSNGTSDNGTQFHNTDVQGTFSANVTFESCLIRDITIGRVVANNSLLAGTITATASGSPLAGEISQFINCRDAKTTSPTFDFGSTTHTLNMQDYVGDITLINMSSTDVAEINLQTGTVTIDASCTGGTVVVKGIGTLIDNGTNVTVDDENLVYDGTSGSGRVM